MPATSEIKLCDIELLSIQIRLLIASVDKAREMGLTWWWQQPEQKPPPPHYLPDKPAPAVVAAQSPWEQYLQFRQWQHNRKGNAMAKMQKNRPRGAAARRRRAKAAAISASIWAACWEVSAAPWKNWSTWRKRAKTSPTPASSRGSTPRASSAASTVSRSRPPWAARASSELKIEPFGNIRRESSGDAVVEDIREPLCDVYDEDDHVLVLAEIPGVSKKDVQLELAGDRLTIRARRGEKRYHKEVVLPETFSPENMQWECTNGILKIRFQR